MGCSAWERGVCVYVPVCIGKGFKMSSFWAYARNDVALRRKPGGQVGRVPLLTTSQSNFVCQVIIHADRVNEGLAPSQVVANVQKVNPNVSKTSARNRYQHTFLLKHNSKLKHRLVKAHKSSLK